MNLIKIKKLCLSREECLLVTDRHGGQWIGVKDALYPVIGLKLDKQSLKVIWELDDKQMDKLDIQERQDLAGVLDTGRVLDESRVLITDKARLDGIHLLGPEMDEAQVMVVPEAVLIPAWKKGDFARYQALETETGTVLMIFVGLMIAGVVKPWTREAARRLLDTLAALGRKTPLETGEAQVW